MSIQKSPVRATHVRAALKGHEPEFPVVDESIPRASVAAVVRDGGEEAEILFIRRADHPDDPWSGHFAFPGGHVDPEDADMASAAVRETLEETGMDLVSSGELIGPLYCSVIPSRRHSQGLLLAAYVFEISYDMAVHWEKGFSPNSEVAGLHWLPLSPMFAGESKGIYKWEINGQKRDMPGYEIGSEVDVVWGLTYRMLQSLFGLIKSSSSGQ